VRRSTVQTLFQRLAETHALPTSVPRNPLLRTHCQVSSKAHQALTDQKRFIGHVPCPCDSCVRGFQRSFSPPHVPPSSPLVGAEEGEGEGEGRQPCAAAPALKPFKPFSIVQRRRMRCSPGSSRQEWYASGSYSSLGLLKPRFSSPSTELAPLSSRSSFQPPSFGPFGRTTCVQFHQTLALT
jgi:hypothetical protein